MTNVLLFGIVIGPLLTVPFEDELRNQGAIDQVNRCMEEHGFKRRALSDGETFWLNNSAGEERKRRLSHLVGGGTVETYVAKAPKS